MTNRSAAKLVAARDIDAAVRKAGAVLFYGRGIVWVFPDNRLNEPLRRLIRAHIPELTAILLEHAL